MTDQKSAWDRHKDQWKQQDEKPHRFIRPSKQEHDHSILSRLNRIKYVHRAKR